MIVTKLLNSFAIYFLSAYCSLDVVMIQHRLVLIKTWKWYKEICDLPSYSFPIIFFSLDYCTTLQLPLICPFPKAYTLLLIRLFSCFLCYSFYFGIKPTINCVLQSPSSYGSFQDPPEVGIVMCQSRESASPLLIQTWFYSN